MAAKLTKALSEVAVGSAFEGSNLTLKEYLEKWLKNSVRDSVRQRTYDRYEQLVRDHIGPLQNIGHQRSSGSSRWPKTAIFSPIREALTSHA